MIKCPKEFWKIMQENIEWDNIIKELEKCGLSMEVVECRKALMIPHPIWDKISYETPSCIEIDDRIIISNLKYKETYCYAKRYEIHGSKKKYEDELNFFKNEICDIVRMKAEKTSKYYKTVEDKEKIGGYTERIESLMETIKTYEDFLDKKYDNYVKINSEFEQNVINGIDEKIKEYNSIKFGTADIILY